MCVCSFCRSTRLLVIHNDPASTWKTEKLQNVNSKCTSTISLTGDRQISANYSMSISTIDQQVGNNLRRLRTSDTRRGGSVDESSPQSSVNTVALSPRGILSPRGPRLFTEVFGLGCSIAFRWAKVKLLSIFTRITIRGYSPAFAMQEMTTLRVLVRNVF